jgi:serine protease Do
MGDGMQVAQAASVRPAGAARRATAARARRRGRAAFLIIPALLLLAAAAVPFVARTHTSPADTGADGADFMPVAQVPQRARGAVNDSVTDGRRTALVRAAEMVAPSVVSVHVRRRETVRPNSFFDQFFFGQGYSREVQGLGSGFIIDANGLVLTNDHVVSGGSEIIVTLPDARSFAAEVVGTDDVTDLALLRITDQGARNLPVAPLGRSDDLVIGEWVIAIGNPFGYLLSNPEPTVTVGVVSGVGRNIIPGDGSRGYYLDMIQTDASINPGNSGGALVNAMGRVVGVNSSIISESGGSVGLGFAIPIDRARRIAEQLARDGRVRRVWVGLDVKVSDANSFGRGSRIEVGTVVPQSPAARAGLRPGMIIDSVGGRAVHSTLDWEARLLDRRVGETLDVIASSGSTRRTYRVATEDLPSLGAERIRAGSDFEFISLTAAIRSERGLINEQGALITGLSDTARRLGLQEGDLVVQLNRTRVTNAQEAASLLRRLSGRVYMVFERSGQLNSVSFYIG